MIMRTFPAHTPSASFACSRLVAVTGARIARSADVAIHGTLSMRGSHIDDIVAPHDADPCRCSNHDTSIDLFGFLVLPGLINAHDHLDFSLFPRLGCGPWRNWREWADEIYRPDNSPVKEHLRVPREIRFWWGAIRNLLSGVTTVSQHDRCTPPLFDAEFPLHVPREFGWAHSLADPVQASERFRRTPDKSPFIIHLAEGTDTAARAEFDELASLIPLDDRVVLVHGLGLSTEQWQRMQQMRMGLVWCPVSNLFSLGQTLSLARVQGLSNVAFGTDSPLTAAGDMLDQIRFTAQELGAPARLLYRLVTTAASHLLRLTRGEGSLQPGHVASFMAVRDRYTDPANTLVQISWRDVELVVESGRIVLLSASLAERIPSGLTDGMEPILVDGVERMLRAPVRELLQQTIQALGCSPSLAGRRLTLSSG
jgi:cytosine/adenosine deaminase-related metal-dependent hydrolase